MGQSEGLSPEQSTLVLVGDQPLHPQQKLFYDLALTCLLPSQHGGNQQSYLLRERHGRRAMEGREQEHLKAEPETRIWSKELTGR